MKNKSQEGKSGSGPPGDFDRGEMGFNNVQLYKYNHIEFLDGACRWLTLEATFQVRFLVRGSNESNLSKPGLSVAPFPELLPKRAIQINNSTTSDV